MLDDKNIHQGTVVATETIDKIDAKKEPEETRQKRIEELMVQQGHGYLLANLPPKYRKRFYEIQGEYLRNKGKTDD